MGSLKQDYIEQIAEELEAGSDCYFHSKTHEIVSIPSFDDIWDEDDFRDAFAEDFDKIEKDEKHFIKLEALKRFESFKIMEQFVAQLPDEKFQLELEVVLANKKPFQYFKNKVESSEFRQSWFDFKQRKLEEHVANLLHQL
ncbi:hypothetical protein F6U93_02770 [Tamlana haliotis]|uniref:Uncharacterized protein n=1 Tax=Pseudotamlana haliotis TaxID=2614804 RepID=A0A6N6MHD9_9FLAO|nr:UPF0158 family protein [Tamlana haliotis]KAB1069752.1 hypothetical protein F6U93_02770 [Tamlana haliotis]